MGFVSCTSVIPAGASVVATDVADSSGTRAAYCSTLALYIYDISESVPRLETILSSSDRTILSIAWNPHDPNAIAMAVAGDEPNVCVWDVAAQTIATTARAPGQAKFVAWSPFAPSQLVAASVHGLISEISTLGAVDLQASEVPWSSRAGACSSATAAGMGKRGRLKVFRVSRRVPDRYVLGFDTGLVHVLTSGRCTMDVLHKGEVVADAQWDPLSEAYLLVGFTSGEMHLYDVEAAQAVQTFDTPSGGGLRSLAWVPGVPGDFVTATDKGGVLRMWNVSLRSPKASLKAEVRLSYVK